MLSSIGTLLFRAAALLLAALAPFRAPLEVRAVDAGHLARPLSIGLVTLGCCIALALWSARRSKLAAVTTLLTVVAALGLAAYFSGVRGPLGRGVVFLAPIEWIAIAALAQAAARGRIEHVWIDRPARAVLAGAGIACVVLVLASNRLESREAMWNAVLQRDPGNERAATFVAEERLRAGRPLEAASALEGCLRANPRACTCVLAGMRAAVDSERAQDAVNIAERAGAACGSDDAILGLNAEALVSTGRTNPGAVLAEQVLLRRPRDEHALLAKSLSLGALGDWRGAASFARQAIDAGRGVPAQLFAAVAAMESNDLDGARTMLRPLVAANPTNARARYNLALIADRKNEYREAREGYLSTLQLDPKMVDARYNLALLTLRAGAKSEAQHHLGKLIEIAPHDPRINALGAAILEALDKPAGG